jgi:hypothetical protein
MNSLAFNSGKWLVQCVLLISFVGALLLPSKSYALAKERQSDKRERDKRKISFGSSIPKGIKVVAMRNYDDEEWYNKLEVEIRNESGKDIWCMEFLVRLPEYAPSAKESLAFITRFGMPASNPPSEEELKKPDYPLLHPGQEYVFRISPYQVENFKKLHSPDGAAVPPVGHLQFDLYKIYFTDGTGFISGRPIILKDGNLIETPNGVGLGPSLPDPTAKAAGVRTLLPDWFSGRVLVEDGLALSRVR